MTASRTINSRTQRDRSDMRLQRLAERLHTLGPAPTFHAIVEIANGADLRQTLERYAALPADFIRQNSGERFAAPFLRSVGEKAA